MPYSILTFFISVPIQIVKTSGSGLGQVNPDPTPKHKTNIGAIIGGVVGGIALIVVIVIIQRYLRRRGREQNNDEAAIVPFGFEDVEPEANPRLGKGANTNTGTTPEMYVVISSSRLLLIALFDLKNARRRKFGNVCCASHLWIREENASFSAANGTK